MRARRAGSSSSFAGISCSPLSLSLSRCVLSLSAFSLSVGFFFSLSLSLCRLSFSLRLRFGGAQRQAPCERPVARAQALCVGRSVRSPRFSRQPRTRHYCCLGVRTLCGERQARQVVTGRRRADCASVPVGLETFGQFGPEAVALVACVACAAASLAPPPTRRPRSTSAASSMSAAAVQSGNARAPRVVARRRLLIKCALTLTRLSFHFTNYS